MNLAKMNSVVKKVYKQESHKVPVDKKLSLVFIGLERVGKTSLKNCLMKGYAEEDYFIFQRFIRRART